MPIKYECKYEDLLDGKCGYVLEKGVSINDETITAATTRVKANIDKIISDIEKTRKVKKFYIGKSYIRKYHGRTKFNPLKSTTWKLGKGVNERYHKHVKAKKGYGKNGLIVVAVVTAESIPRRCRKKGYITHQEEYALTLEKRLIQKYIKDEDKRLHNEGTDPGKTDGGKSIGYVVYIAFTADEAQELSSRPKAASKSLKSKKAQVASKSVKRCKMATVVSRKECCRCNSRGKCKNCVCVKAKRVCTNCLPSRKGCCSNSSADTSQRVTAPRAPPPQAASTSSKRAPPPQAKRKRKIPASRQQALFASSKSKRGSSSSESTGMESCSESSESELDESPTRPSSKKSGTARPRSRKTSQKSKSQD